MFDKNIPVQVIGQNLDKMYKGCLGIILEEKGNRSVVGFYTPQESGKNPFIKKVEFNNDDLFVIGGLKLKPIQDKATNV